MNGSWRYLVPVCLLLSNAAGAFELSQPNQTARLPLEEQRTATEVWRSTLDTNDLLKAPRPLSFGIEVTTDNYGNQKVTSYQQLNLTPEKSVSLSFDRYKPRVKFRAGSLNTAIKLRGDGVKLQFNPVDKTIPLEIEIKVTDDESSLRVDYRF
ncbi:hypothetical protein [Aeromonas finlandensis]|uniref:hypothetical protein n=1 Tax=Aeromonas finlandensis TaxID=1543375 RepID=UPI00051B3F0E|nr:hypothetical protein [Aeromonas finlandensis]